MFSCQIGETQIRVHVFVADKVRNITSPIGYKSKNQIIRYMHESIQILCYDTHNAPKRYKTTTNYSLVVWKQFWLYAFIG